MAETDKETALKLAAITETDSDVLQELWQRLATENDNAKPKQDKDDKPITEQFIVLVECDDEAQQVALLKRFHKEKLRCRALMS